MIGVRFFASVCSLFAFTVASVATAQARDPVGERADYVLDRAASRTSSMVVEGALTAHVDSFDEGAAAYNSSIDYAFKIRFLGWQRGTQGLAVDAAYFTPEFMVALRESGEYRGEKFDVRWLGYVNARTMEGGNYPHCDEILIYNIDQGFEGSFAQIARNLIANAAGAQPTDTIDDLTIRAAIFQGVPVLGAVKLDITGKYNGTNIKAGADYDAP